MDSYATNPEMRRKVEYVLEYTLERSFLGDLTGELIENFMDAFNENYWIAYGRCEEEEHFDKYSVKMNESV